MAHLSECDNGECVLDLKAPYAAASGRDPDSTSTSASTRSVHTEATELAFSKALIRHVCKVAQLTPEGITQLLDCVTGAEPMVESYMDSLAEMLVRQAVLGLFGSREGPNEVTASPVITTPSRVLAPSLSPAVETEYRKYRFKSRLPVEIVGQERRRTLIVIGGREAQLTEKEFEFFLRLVVALFDRPDGYEPLGDRGPGLAKEEWFAGERMEGLANNVRDRLRPFIAPIKHTDFIQIVDRQVRLSTHRTLITYDRQCLLSHKNARIREFAKRLPDLG